MQVFSFRAGSGSFSISPAKALPSAPAGDGAAVPAQPAFNLTSDNWLKAQDLAVTFLDRYGTEVGRRGIKHDDSLKFDDFPS